MNDKQDKTRTRLSNVWHRDENVIDVFMDFEFWDRGVYGTNFISAGLVLVSGSKVESKNAAEVLTVKRLYGIDTSFWMRSENSFKDMAKRYLAEDKNAVWMFENVFKQIDATALDNLKGDSGSYNGVAADERWTYDLKHWIDKDPKHTLGEIILPCRDTALPSSVVQVIGNKARIRNALLELIKSFEIEDPVLRTWGYYAAHDHVCLSQLFGAMIDMPENWNFYDYDLRAMTDIYGYEHDDFNPAPANPHHALSDANAQYLTTRALWERLRRDGVIWADDNAAF